MLRLLLLASVMGPPPTSSAPEPEAPAEQRDAPTAVEDVTFALVGDWDDELARGELEPVLAANLADLGIAIEVTTRPPGNTFSHRDWARELETEEPGRVVFWIVRRDAETVELYVLPRGSDGYGRDVPLPEGADDLAESLAVIVRSIVESLPVGPPSGMRTLEPDPQPKLEPAPQPRPDPEPEPDPGPRARIGLSYLGTSLAANAPWQSGTALDVGIRFPMRLTAAVTSGWTTGRARHELSQLRVHRVPLGLFIGYAFDPSRRVSGRVGATATAELMWWRPQASAGLNPGLDFRLGLGVRADLLIHLHRGLGLVVSGAGVGWLRNIRVDVGEVDATRTVLRAVPIGAELRGGLQYEF